MLDAKLSTLVFWPEREQLWNTMPVCFQYAFGNKVTVVIDCFELFIERPSNLQGPKHSPHISTTTL